MSMLAIGGTRTKSTNIGGPSTLYTFYGIFLKKRNEEIFYFATSKSYISLCDEEELKSERQLWNSHNTTTMQKTAAAVLFEEEDKLSLLRGDSLKEEKLATVLVFTDLILTW